MERVSQRLSAKENKIWAQFPLHVASTPPGSSVFFPTLGMFCEFRVYFVHLNKRICSKIKSKSKQKCKKKKVKKKREKEKNLVLNRSSLVLNVQN